MKYNKWFSNELFYQKVNNSTCNILPSKVKINKYSSQLTREFADNSNFSEAYFNITFI